MRLYLDLCALQRPLDDPSQLRIRLEAEAVLGVLEACASGAAVLLTSDVHLLEIQPNPYPRRRAFVLEALALAPVMIPFTPPMAARARAFGEANITGADALHLAAAVEAAADYFCTSDDRLLRRSARADTGGVSVVSPLELATILCQP